MSTYKVIQDIEAEDHILGPLSLRQFIYALVAVFFLYLCFVSITKHVAFLLIVFFPPAAFFGFFAFPFGKDQPTEIWALAKIRFFFKPRRRVWDQSGLKELVTITVPKKIIVDRTNGLSQNEVKSRLNALADTLDTRGWAIKNVSTNTYSRPGLFNNQSSERLLEITSMPQAVPDYVEDPGSDILDNQASPLAQQFGSMIQTSNLKHRQQLLATMSEAKQNTTKHLQWFSPTGQQGSAQPNAHQVFTTQLSADLAAQAESHVQPQTPIQQPTPVYQTPAPQPATQQPAYQQPVVQTAVQQPVEPAMPAAPDPAILNLAKRNDLNVSTLAREASRAKGLSNDEEVVISLH